MTRATVVFPLSALFAAVLAAIQIAADSGFAFCNDRMSMSMPDMPGMDAAATHTVMICPIALLLIVLSALLGAVAVVLIWCDPGGCLSRAVAALLRRRRIAAACAVHFSLNAALADRAIPLLAAGRGLRAPPPFSGR